MTGERIRYAVIALCREEAGSVADGLEAAGSRELAGHLRGIRDGRYGETSRDWKPFGAEPLTEILESHRGALLPQHEIIEALDDVASNYEVLSDANLDAFFLDSFATLLPKYRKLARAMDLFVCEGVPRRCCIVFDDALPSEIRNAFRADYRKIWPALFRRFAKGAEHATVTDQHELLNFLYQLEATPRADPDASEEFGKRLGPSYRIDRVSLSRK